MALLSQSLEKKDKLNDLIVTFNFQKINYNGIDGFFIPFTSYKNLVLVLNDYIYYQDLLELKNSKIKELEKLDTINFKLKTGLAVSISFNVGSILLTAGLGILCYNLAVVK